MKRPSITPGDWHIGKRAGAEYGAIYGAKGEEIALPLGFFMEDSEAKANTKVIAAVPDLLAALEALVRESGRSMDDLDSDVSSHHPLIAAYEALTKAGYEFP